MVGLTKKGVTPSFWQNRRVFLTGHTGFKGSWLSLWLTKLGSEVHGFALEPTTEPALFNVLGLDRTIQSRIADIRDDNAVADALHDIQPEVVFHLAAQPLVGTSYEDPLTTYATNVMGTAHLLEAVRHQASVRAVVVVTTDKCYQNREWVWGYREVDRLGGHDPYSSSKACAELLTQAYRDSFFSNQSTPERSVGIATARAGNVIGGGDWAPGRLLPDAMRAFGQQQMLKLRYPLAIRPWQYVLEPLAGYLMLAENLYHDAHRFSGPWNFGPKTDCVTTVQSVVSMAAKAWYQGRRDDELSVDAPNASQLWEAKLGPKPHESGVLLLDSTKSHTRLGWKQVYSIEEVVGKVVAFSHAWIRGDDMKDHCLHEIAQYEGLSGKQVAVA